ncbi:MD-2-related lipid recognition domain-containing protein / ML domain-containing protein [Prunus dulcis]|uniref:MD-2-related lipid recognition domain-containing protein / ML domain-containing protein n=1 Tax=Prunus dulcis TaxID=3755 RepID=A0A4Y1RT80_PRUDU|nr:MD-2-related lipid recognition domain-containing protein / ML domain-containing protein [Prunus dulcis]
MSHKKADYDVKVKAVEIIPYPVARGKPASFSISATTGESISGGKLVIEVSYFGWHIHSETHDLCSETSCPFQLGSYSLKMRLYDGNKHELTCIAFDFDIGFASSDSSVADSARHVQSLARSAGSHRVKCSSRVPKPYFILKFVLPSMN